MNILKYFRTHKLSILSLLLVAAAAALGADCGLAMAVDVVTDASDNASVQDKESLEAGLQKDSAGLDTQQQGNATTATDTRDKGLEADDIDPEVAAFRPFRFPIEWYIANKCKQVKSNSYVHSHYRSGATVLEDTYNGLELTVKKSYFTVPCSDFANGAESLTECSEVFVPDVDGYADNGTDVDGDLTLYVQENDGANVKMIALNSKDAGVKIPAGATFVVGATACSESQMKVAPESYLPESDTLYLQKKIANVIITDEWKEQAKKVPFITRDVLHNGLYNFKRKCARSHWLGRQARLDVKVAELNGSREATYFEKGILRQIPMVYTFNGDDFQFDDFMAMTKLQFTENAANNYAVAFCGKNAITRIMKLANSVTTNRNIEFTDVKEMGIKIRKWTDNFGTLDFVHDPTLDDIGYEDFIAIIDIENAVRYYKRNEKQQTQDMKKTGESREAERTMISMIDCIGLKGYNAVLVCPASKLDKAQNLEGISAYVETATASSPASLDVTKKYYLSESRDGFNAGTIITYDADLKVWKEFDGDIYNA